jgi:hypothetical protein
MVTTRCTTERKSRAKLATNRRSGVLIAGVSDFSNRLEAWCNVVCWRSGSERNPVANQSAATVTHKAYGNAMAPSLHSTSSTMLDPARWSSF